MWVYDSFELCKLLATSWIDQKDIFWEELVPWELLSGFETDIRLAQDTWNNGDGDGDGDGGDDDGDGDDEKSDDGAEKW